MADPKKEEFAGTLKTLLWNVWVWWQCPLLCAWCVTSSVSPSQIHELESTICDYDGNQDVLQDRVYVHFNSTPCATVTHHLVCFQPHRTQLTNNLRVLALQRDAVDFYIPMELLRYLDDGGNPDSFTTEAFERAQEDNQIAKGRIDALQYVGVGVGECVAMCVGMCVGVGGCGWVWVGVQGHGLSGRIEIPTMTFIPPTGSFKRGWHSDWQQQHLKLHSSGRLAWLAQVRGPTTQHSMTGQWKARSH